jgi:hypothetical protein
VDGVSIAAMTVVWGAVHGLPFTHLRRPIGRSRPELQEHLGWPWAGLVVALANEGMAFVAQRIMRMVMQQ